MKAIILIAGIGNRLRSVSDNPKCLLKIGGTALIERYLNALETAGISDIVLVTGYKHEAIKGFINDLKPRGNIRFIQNPDFTRGSILSLYRAKDELDGNVLLMDGDVYFENAVLTKLLAANDGNAIAIDTTSTSSGEEVMVGVRDGRVADMKRSLTGDFDIHGEAVGFFRFDAQGCRELKAIMEEEVASQRTGQGYEDMLPLLFQKVSFAPVVVDGLEWVEIDFAEDVKRAEKLAGA